MEQKSIVGLGEILWDMLPEGPKLGGAPANFAYHVAQHGLRGCVASAVGTDHLGKEILDTLADKNLPCVMATVPFPTGTVEIEVDAGGIPRYDIKTGAAWDNIPYTDDLRTLALNTRAVCFGSLAQRSPVTRATIRKFLSDMPRTEDSLVVFDVNLRQNFFTREILHESMTECNILKINDEELGLVGTMFGLEGDFRQICRALIDRYSLRTLILTCGATGSYVFTPDAEYFRPTPVVEVADTIGAGDSFTAAFIAALIKGKSVEEAHALAVDISAYVCTCKGAMPEYPENFNSQCI